MSNQSYYSLAPYYDALMEDISYDQWAAFIQSILLSANIGPSSLILDAGCGTGQMTVRLAKMGYDMIGVDISPEMLSAASALSAFHGVSPLFICQDMSDIELYGTVKACISCLDSLNYLTRPGEFERFFALMHNYVEKDGLLIFDLNTKEKFSHIYGDNAYILEDEGVFLGWQNYFNEKSGLCTFDLSLFVCEKDGRYTRHDERHIQRYHSPRRVKALLKKHGFEILGVYSDFSFTPACEKDHRHYYLCKRL